MPGDSCRAGRPGSLHVDRPLGLDRRWGRGGTWRGAGDQGRAGPGSRRGGWERGRRLAAALFNKITDAGVS